MLKNIKTYFLTGLAVSLPIVISIYIVWAIFNFIDQLIFGKLTFVKHIPGLNHIINIMNQIPGIGFLTTIIFIILMGVFARNVLGRTLLNYFDRVMSSLPLVKSIYTAVKQIVDAIFTQKNNAFQRVVLVEYPRKGVYAIAFVTNETKGEAQAKTEKNMISVFLPTTPNPTSGFLLLVPEEDLILLDMSVEEGIKMIISAGVVTPPYKEKKEEYRDVKKELKQ